MNDKNNKKQDMPIFIALAVFIFIGVLFLAYIAEMTSDDGQVQIMDMLNDFGTYANLGAVPGIFKALFTGNGITRSGAMLGLAGGGLLILYKMSETDKRFHKKGIEHGSAHWGSKSEKNIIADTNDLYNNLLIASDVFLVVDRKQRDINDKNKKAKKKIVGKCPRCKKTVYEQTSAFACDCGFKLNRKQDCIKERLTLDTATKLIKGESVVFTESETGERALYSMSDKDGTVSIMLDRYIDKRKEEERLERVREEEESRIDGTDDDKPIIASAADMADEDTKDAVSSEEALTETEKPEKKEKKKKQEFSDDAVITSAQLAARRKTSQKIKPMLNLNMLILGGSGTGKSRFFVKPNLLQCNTSFVVTDPSGELIQSCGKMLERMGYRIKVFNINDMKHSSNYNPFHYLRDSDGNINNNNVIKMINVFMMNTKVEGASGGDQFWDDATRLLLSAVCFLLIETGSEEEQNFSSVLDMIHLAKVIDGKEEQKSELDLIFDKHKENSPKALSCQYYDEFKQAAGKTMQSILISTTTKLQHFKLDDVRNLTFTDNIHLETLGDEKTALFIIIPSSDTTFNFLAAMMYTQLFDTLYDRAISYYHGHLKYNVNFMLDEFANIGKIPEFEKILATCRKFGIGAQVILQNLSQLKRMYEKSWEELPGNCDTVLYLGGKDQSTNEYISKELGKETIDTLSINKTKSRQGSTSYNDGIMGRELATIDELLRMDNNDCIVMVRGLPPFFTPKFDVSNHPRYKMLDEADPVNNTYYLKNEIETVTETEEIEFTGLDGLFSNDSTDDVNAVECEIVCGGKPTKTVEEAEILDFFKDLSVA